MQKDDLGEIHVSPVLGSTSLFANLPARSSWRKLQMDGCVTLSNPLSSKGLHVDASMLPLRIIAMRADCQSLVTEDPRSNCHSVAQTATCRISRLLWIAYLHDCCVTIDCRPRRLTWADQPREYSKITYFATSIVPSDKSHRGLHGWGSSAVAMQSAIVFLE